MNGLNPQVQSAPFSLEMVSVLLVDVLPLAVLEGELELEPALQAATPSTPATMMTPYLMRRLMVSSLLLFVVCGSVCFMSGACLRPIPGCPFR